MEVKVKGVYMNSIALVMIVKNEEKFLSRCLESVKPYLDDIIVLDTGSEDQTQDIARSHGARIFEAKWQDDFAYARNTALSHSKCDFNLVLDADEFIVKWDKEAVSAFMDKQEIGKIKIISHFSSSDGTDTAWSYISRLFPNGISYKGIIHEQLDSHLPREIIPIEVNHDGYHREATEKNKSSRNIPLLKKALSQDPKNTYYRYKLSMDYKGIGNYQAACGHMNKAYASVDRNSTIYSSLVVDYIYLLMNIKDYESALKIIEKEQNYIGNSSGFYFVSGLLYVKLILSDVKKYINYFNRIESSFIKCLQIGEDTGDGGVVGTGSFAALYNLGVFYEMTKKIPEAIECYEKAATYEYAPAIERLKKLRS